MRGRPRSAWRRPAVALRRSGLFGLVRPLQPLGVAVLLRRREDCVWEHAAETRRQPEAVKALMDYANERRLVFVLTWEILLRMNSTF